MPLPPNSLKHKSAPKMPRLVNRGLLSAGFLLLTTACATSRPYIYNQTQMALRVEPATRCEITFLRAYEDEGEIVLYGKVDRSNDQCASAGSVRLVIDDVKGVTILDTSLPLRAGSNRLHGWSGAAFRTRLRDFALKPYIVRLSVQAVQDRSNHELITAEGEQR